LIAAAKNCFCCLERALRTAGFHISKVLGVERRVPSPEQGTSKRILSNLYPSFFKAVQKFIESLRETIVFVTPQRSRFEIRIFVLSDFRSFAIRVPLFCILAAIWVVLEPGDAKRSKINSFGFGSRAIVGSIEEISWT